MNHIRASVERCKVLRKEYLSTASEMTNFIEKIQEFCTHEHPDGTTSIVSKFEDDSHQYLECDICGKEFEN